ncbi:carbohydrate ABC transporter permease [Lactonifactor longoviformis]|uniref:Multiple sugar transport system permease protein n=3 Tax=Lactonifactor TaxID=420345 RepID=A0A1M4W3V1_9CLOT|nr:sugar ABC transporter permease [Lactonifactor longoviformis]SHE75877.1 multiple sugar transport system permease protein [Lactonifactor longoviformis DSM 17459]
MRAVSAREKRRRLAGYSLIAPAVLILIITFAVPLLYSFIISISDSNAIVANKFELVGLKNYISVLQNSKFQSALFHTCFFVITTIILEFIIGFIVALLLYRETAGSKFFKLIFAVPLMVAPVVSGLQWRWLFADQYGIINHLLSKIGIEAPLWFTTAQTSWVTIIVANLWLAAPFVILVLLAGLGGLSEEMNEAAEIDGANKWQVFRSIILPQLKPTILIILVIRLTDAFRIYDLIYILTGGGPGGKTEVLSTYIYKRIFTDWDFGRGSAASFIVMVIICLLSLLCSKLMSEKEE